MEQDEIRRLRLRHEAAKIGGAVKLADLSGKSESQISQIIGENPTRNIGKRLARLFEELLGLDKFSLDSLPSAAQSPPQPAAQATTETGGDPRAAILAANFHWLTPDEKKTTFLAVKAMADWNRWLEKHHIKGKVSPPPDTYVESKLNGPKRRRKYGKNV